MWACSAGSWWRCSSTTNRRRVPRGQSWPLRIVARPRMRRSTRRRRTSWPSRKAPTMWSRILGVTRDRALVCLHDTSLERTTNVEEVFPDRFTTDPATGARRWMAVDFTLAEIKRLDAGSWFDPKFAGERVPTWQEAVAIVGDRAGLYPELKSPALYASRNIDMVALVVSELKRGGFDRPSSGLRGAPRPPIVLQSFDAEALRALASALPSVPRVFLFEPKSAGPWISEQGLRDITAFATGIGPHKAVLDGRPEIVRAAHAAAAVGDALHVPFARHGALYGCSRGDGLFSFRSRRRCGVHRQSRSILPVTAAFSWPTPAAPAGPYPVRLWCRRRARCRSSGRCARRASIMPAASWTSVASAISRACCISWAMSAIASFLREFGSDVDPQITLRTDGSAP